MKSFEEKIKLIIEQAIQDKVFPGAVFVILKDNEIVFSEAFGHFTYDLNSPVVNKDTLYDIASVSKQIVATGVIKLIELGKLKLNEPIMSYLPNIKTSLIGNRTILQLLTHTSGIKVEMSKLSKKELDELLLGNLPDSLSFEEPNLKVEYCNINTYLLGEIISEVSGKSLETFLKEEIFIPLDMKDIKYCPNYLLSAQIPPTEILNDGSTIQGIVHDESSRILGGKVGQAGLFSSAIDLAKFISFWINDSVNLKILKKETKDLAVKNYTKDKNLNAGLGWHLDNKTYLGNYFESGTFFHPGFTGTIIGSNRKNNIGFVFLSNSSYPKREGNKLKNRVFQSLLDETFLRLIQKNSN